MPSTELYTLPLVRRLLNNWRELELGLWPPSDHSLPEGYRGKRAVPIGGFEVALEAAADLELAVSRLDSHTAEVVRRRYYDGHKRAPGEPAWNQLVELVWAAINMHKENSDAPCT